MTARTLNNLLAAGGMEGSGWSGSYSTAHAMDGTQSLALTGTESTPEVVAETTETIPLEPSHIYYARVYGWQDARTEATVGFYWPIAEPSFREGIPTGAAGQWVMYSARSGRSGFTAGSYPFRLDFNNSNIAGTMYFDGAMLIDLTEAYGAGAEPSQEWCDANIPYFPGSYVVADYAAGDALEFAYSGAVQTLTLKPGVYKLEAWGAQGGYYSASYGEGGKGAYASGELTLTQAAAVHIRAGGAGSYVTATATWGGGGWNGGGDATYYGGGGGGASDIRLSADTLYDRILIAAGGGGAQGRASTSYKAAGGYGGAEQGGDGEYYNGNSSATYNGKGATQTAGGASGTYSSYPAESGALGKGGNAGRYTSTTYRGSGAGGGGLYGGGGGAYRYAGGGGGSSYAAALLAAAILLAGNAAVTDPDGSVVTGHSGDGHVRITVEKLGILPENLRAETGYTSVTLFWDAQAEADGYNVYRDGALIASGLTTATYTDTGLTPDTTYLYGVSAVTGGEESSAATVTATTDYALLISGPQLSAAILVPNPATINASVILTVTVEDETVLYTPRWYYAGEIYAGEET